MTGLFPPRLKDPGGDSLRIWEKDRARVEQDIVEGLPLDAFVSERGRFDAMFDFMLRNGLWKTAAEMRPSGLKKDNGIPYRLLHGVECLREMAGIDTPANYGPLLKDTYLLERIGFTAEKVASRLAQGSHRDRSGIAVEPSGPFHGTGSGSRFSPTLGGDPQQALVAGRGVCRGWT